MKNPFVVVEAQPAAAADAAFAKWLDNQGLHRDQVPPDAVRVDTIRSLTGMERRYLVLKSFLEDVAIKE